MENCIVPDVRKILVLRALVLGDLIFILPALDALHAAYPQAEIVYAGRPWTRDFLSQRLPSIQRVVGIRASTVDFGDTGFIIHPDDAGWFFEAMQAEKFDLAFQMQGGGRNSNPLIQRIGARVSIGSREQGAIPLDRWIGHDYYQHDVIRNLDLARLAGAAALDWSPHLPVLPSDLQAAAPFLAEIERPFAVLHPGARDIRRCWPPERFAVLGDTLKREYGLEIVVTGSAVDDRAALLVEDRMEEGCINLSHQLSLPALAGLLSKSQVMVSNDTGVLHLGLAVGAKAVGLYWAEYISKSMPLSRSHFMPVIAWERHCPYCGKFLDQQEVVEADPRPCRHSASFLTGIQPDQVIQAVEKLLLQEQPRA